MTYPTQPSGIPSGHVQLDALLAHRQWIRAIARALTADPNEADDVVQAAWTRALARPPEDDGALRAWWRRVVRNVASDRRRARDRRSSHEIASMPRAGTLTPDELAARAEIHRRVVEAVIALAEPYRRTILLRFFEGLPTVEIAERDGVSEAAVRKRVQRALEMLRSRLDDECAGDRAAWIAVLAPLGEGSGVAATGVERGLAARTSSRRTVRSAVTVTAVALVGVALVASAVVSVLPSSGAGGADRVGSASSSPRRDGEVGTRRGEKGTGVGTGSGVASIESAEPKSSHAPDELDTAVVCGRVVSAADESPLAGVAVSVGAVAAHTDSDGEFRLVGVPPRSGATLRAQLDDLSEALLALPNLPPGDETRLSDIRLGPPVSIGVRVIDAGGAPVAGAQVRVYGTACDADGEVISGYEVADLGAFEAAATAITDESGRARPICCAQGGIALLAESPEHATSAPLGLYAVSASEREHVLMIDDVTSVHGRALDAASGAPVAGALVEAVALDRQIGQRAYIVGRGRSGGDGSFVLDGVPATILRLTAVPKGGIRTTAELIDARTCPVAEILVDPTTDVAGVVVDAVGGEPVPDARVTLTLSSRGHTQTVRCGADGRFRVSGLPRLCDGHITVQAVGSGSVRRRTTSPVRFSTSVRGATELRVPIVALGTIAGRVLTSDGTPVVGARVVGLGARREMSTVLLGAIVATGRSGTDGTYRLDDVLPDAVEVIAQGAGQVSGRVLTGMERMSLESEARIDDPRVTVAAGETVRHDVITERAYGISGRVFDAAGAPVTGAHVVTANRHLGSDFAAAATSGADGSFVLRDVPRGDGGDVRVSVHAGSGSAERTVALTAEHSVRDADMVLTAWEQERARIEGRVVGPEGLPRGTKVRLLDNGAQSSLRRDLRESELLPIGAVVELGDDGRFSVEGLTPRDDMSPCLIVFAPGYRPTRAEVVLHPGETSNVELTLRSGPRVSGRLVDANGTAAGGVPVKACSVSARRTDNDGLPPAALTAADGSFVLDPVPDGQLALVFGFGNRRLHVHDDVTAGDEGVLVTLPPGVDASRPVLPVVPRDLSAAFGRGLAVEGEHAPVALTGRVVDASGNPVAQAHVSVEFRVGMGHSRSSAATNREGRFEVRCDAGVVADVRIDGGVRGTAFRPGVLTGPDASLDVTLDAPGPEVEGRVVAADGKAAVDVIVHAVREDDFQGEAPSKSRLHGERGLLVTSSEREVLAARDGSFSLGVLPHGRWLVWAGGLDEASTPDRVVTCGNDESEPLELPVVRGWTLRLRTLAADGTPQSDVQLGLRVRDALPSPLRGMRAWLMTGADGVATLTGIPPGAIQVSRSGSGRSKPLVVDPRPDDAEPLDVPPGE